MSRLIWVLLLLAGLFWTGLAWLLHSIAGAGSAAVVKVSNWLSIDPANTQWLADLLNIAGTPIQIIVWIAWAVGVAVLCFTGFVLNRATTEAERAAEAMQRMRRERGPVMDVPPPDVLDVEVTSKHIRRP